MSQNFSLKIDRREKETEGIRLKTKGLGDVFSQPFSIGRRSLLFKFANSMLPEF